MCIRDRNVNEDRLAEVFRDQSLLGNEAEAMTTAPLAPASNEDAQLSLPCSAGHTACYVSPYGEVFPCVQFPYLAGNIRKQPFADIWQPVSYTHLSCSSQPNCSNSILDISPVTYAKNPNTNLEYIYFSESRDATANGCTGACVYMYPVNTMLVPATPASQASWTFTITNNPFWSNNGIPSNETGTFTVNGTAYQANIAGTFSTAGNRNQDRDALVTFVTVSYTHLDVYKRQPPVS